MLNKKTIWIVSFFITVSLAMFQRLTGPTYPVRGKLPSSKISYKLPRSCNTDSPCIVKVNSGDFKGRLEYKRFKTSDEFTPVNFSNAGEVSTAVLPAQPPAGKLEYRLFDENNNELVSGVIIRFKGPVPAWILIPHIIFMFSFMLYSVKIFLSLNTKNEISLREMLLNFSFLILGGFILGPLTQYYAFGYLWTGFPFGHDLTDNKTLAVLIVWAAALYAFFKNKKKALWINLAFLVTALTYLVPHSLLGSELDYQKIENAGK